MRRLLSSASNSAIILTGIALCVVCPRVVFAQASIAGTVDDRSGAPLAGVVVEAASPALIERVRLAVTDRTGQYAIVGLPPGTFSVAFKLAGFTALTRTAIHTTGSFVTTVDATLEIGALAEKVEVRTPLIDRQSTQQAVAITAGLIADIPSGRSLANLAGLIPGVTTISARAQSDVGGVNNLQNQFVAIHGGRFSDQRTYVDGVTIRNLQSEGHATNFTPDMSSTQEVVIDTAGVSAEEGGAGVRANYIPRTGGNTLHASLFATGATGAFQDSNLTRELQARGQLSPESLKLTYDVNPAIGGPIVRDRAWFFAAGRAQSNQAYIGGIFENRNAGNPSAWTYDPDPSRPGRFAITQQSVNARVTWRPTPRQKVGGFVEKQWRSWDEGNVARAPEAFSRFRFSKNQIAILSWSATISDRLLLEARGAYHAEEWLNVGGDELLPNNRALIPVLEQGGAFPGLMYRAKNGVYSGQSAPFIKIGEASATYVTGAHVVKGGFDLLGGRNTNVNTFNDSALQYRLNDGVPNQVTAFATPYTLAWRVTELGAFVQDRWTRNRVTLNAGVRLDAFTTSFPQQHLGPATLFPTRNMTFPAADWYGLKDLSPRLGGAVDLTGTGRTVVKATAGRYVVALSPAAGNPISSMPLSVTRIWNDADRDYVPDCDLVNSAPNGECGVMSDGNFGGTTPSLSYDPAILRGWNVRPHNWEISAGLQHELRPHVAASIWYVRRIYGDFTVQDNRATSAGDYTAFTVPAPVDARFPGAGGYPVGGLYDLNPDKRGVVDNYVTASDRYGRQIEHWNGIDAVLTVTRSRLMIQGGLSTGRTSTDVCSLASRLPEILGAPGSMTGVRAIPSSLDQCRVETSFLTQAKWVGRYLIPRIDVQVAGTFQSTPGVEVQATYLAPNAVVQPSLGRPLSGGTTASVPLLPPGRVYGDRVNQVDLRVGKVFRSAGIRTGINFDLYNAFNASPVTSANMNYTGNGAAWLQPQAILPARLFKVSAQIEF